MQVPGKGLFASVKQLSHVQDSFSPGFEPTPPRLVKQISHVQDSFSPGFEPTPLGLVKQISHMQESFSLQGRYAIHLHRPTQGWTVREYILLCQVSKLHPPSSLGLDGQGQLLPRCKDTQEVPKKPTSPCSPIGFPCTASESPSVTLYLQCGCCAISSFITKPQPMMNAVL